ncbi:MULTISPECIES: type II toxin-antitoxin system RelE/ParE family toxin [Stutzerimonas]|uniref:type II toxin-antitoxin system RelE/ParE family toxin n=1 Tax=Stutzerimonas TaxID=2901164 RepID=UPI0003575C8C|nr:plasmid stabilization system protein [Stutzerimonas stutzeri B1SMN1]QXP24063.1 type II toxin-antitoxin system RelE/ParE family toxin [Stutzerimonas stutzeri]
MTWQVLFEPPAEAEIVAAFEWYEQHSYGLGGDFLRAVAAAAEHLARSPDSFPASRQRFRRILLRRFPYALHYEILSDQRVSVLACLHHRRSPKRWPGN